MSSPSHAARYAPFAAIFTVLAGSLVHSAVSRRRQPETTFVALAEDVLATYFLTRTVAKEKIGSIVREPFVEPAPDADPDDAHGEAKQPAGSGFRHAVGELVTCTRCLGPWMAAVVTSARVVAPEHGRTATRIAALAGASTIAHAGVAALGAASERGQGERIAPVAASTTAPTPSSRHAESSAPRTASDDAALLTVS